MKKRIALYLRSFFSLWHIAFVKLFNMRGFFSAAIQDFSFSTRISLYNKGKIFLKRGIHTKRNVFFEADGGTLEIGEGCFFNNGCMAVARESIKIGSYTSFGPNTLIYDHDHNIQPQTDIHDSGFLTSPVIIGDNVWIGANCVILRGSVIGDGCVIGAGSVIKGTYPPDTVIIQQRSERIKSRNKREESEVHKV